MTLAQLKKIVVFYQRFLVSFSAIGFRGRSLFWPRLDADFSGQTWLVTGASGGIGEAVAAAAAQRGATVIAVARSAEKLARLMARNPERIIAVRGDLSLVADTRRVLREVAGLSRKLDVLVNNVGVMLDDLTLTAEGFETSYATNILNHFVLTEGLLAADGFKPGAAVINMSSGGMYNAPLTLDYMGMKTPGKYSGVYAYAVAKRGQAELTKYWQGLHGARGMHFYVMHPGWADTAGVRTAMPRFRRMLRLVLRNDAQGADTAIWLAATRPSREGPEAFWFDRAPRPAHAYPATSISKYTPANLADFLRRDALSVAQTREPA
jgi:dehydrogenase/reductase SDR family protein 12